MTNEEFLQSFRFRPDLAGFVGIEVEGFLRDPQTSLVVPRAVEFLDGMRGSIWGPELSACQVEFRTRPLTSFGQIEAELADSFEDGEKRAAELGLTLDFCEVGPADMPLDVYPHSARYQRIAAELGEDRLRAASRVAGVHVHYGCTDWADAIKVYGALRRNLPALVRAGDNSAGERLRLYHEVVQRRDPPVLTSTDDLIREAVADGFFESPRGCWWLLRISPYGTVEVRVFGTTRDTQKIVGWVRTVSEIARPSVSW